MIDLSKLVTAEDKLRVAKIAKNAQINSWREQANKSSFPHMDKIIACDSLSRSDIDGVAASITLTGDFPYGWQGCWKCVDNSYIQLPTTESFTAMYSSMTAQGATNFAHSQALKASLAAATTIEDVHAITWAA